MRCRAPGALPLPFADAQVNGIILHLDVNEHLASLVTTTARAPSGAARTLLLIAAKNPGALVDVA